MAIAKKSVIWGLFAAGGTVTAFLFPALIALFLLVATGYVPSGLAYASFQAFAAGWFGLIVVCFVISLALGPAAPRLRGVVLEFGVRKDKVVARAVYLIAAIGTVLTAYYLYAIR